MELETGDGEIRCGGPGNALRLDFDRRLMLSVPRLFDHL